MKISSVESLELLFSKLRKNYFCISYKESPFSEFFRENLPKENILFIERLNRKGNQAFWNSEKQFIKKTNLSEVLIENNVNFFMPGLHSSTALENWVRKNSKKLLVTPWTLQKKLENKIFFDKLLRKLELPVPDALILKSEKDILSIKKFPVVVQIPESEGSRGTFIINNKAELVDLFASRKFKFPLLCREFIENGLSVGVSLLIGSKKMIFSALRLQLYLKCRGETNQFFGIQWLRSDDFPERILKKLEENLVKLAHAFQQLGFRGMASIDFILGDDGAFFLECNPRHSGASMQLTERKELLHGCDYLEEFFRATTGGDLTANIPNIPGCNYQGTSLDLDYLVDLFCGKEIRNSPTAGVYKLKNNGSKFSSLMVENYRNSDDILFLHVLKKGQEINKDGYLGFCLTHKPFVEVLNNELKFSDYANDLFNSIENLIFNNEEKI